MISMAQLGKESVCNAGDPSLSPGSGRSPGKGNSYPLQYSCLANSMDRRAWWTTAHEVTESDPTQQLTLLLFSSTFLECPGGTVVKKSACQCRRRGSIPGSGRSPGERSGNPLQYSCPGKSHGQRSLVSYSPWGRKESDTTKQLNNINRLNTTQSRTQGSFPSFSGT